MWKLDLAEARFLMAAVLLSLLTLALFLVRSLLAGRFEFTFIPGNLALAWLALAFSWLLIKNLNIMPWSDWRSIVLTILWLVFLPNAWYVLTDFIHIEPTAEVSQLYDITLIFSLVFTGFMLGFTSLYLVHKQIFARMREALSNFLVAGIILLASFAIYLGRDLRWNTWDVISDPRGLIINVSDRVLDPFGHPRALNVTLLFFILLSSLYFAFWLFVRPEPPRQKTRSPAS